MPELKHSATPSAMAPSSPRSIGVLIATYRRPTDLLRCLASLQDQARKPDEVIVILRNDDEATRSALDEATAMFIPLKRVEVDLPGAVNARNAGLAICTTDIVTILDDDTVAMPDFLEKVFAAFGADPSLGGLGGRDRCFGPHGFEDDREPIVGKICWYGKVIGNHHLGFGSIRSVDLLKGANMSFRAEAVAQVRFDTGLRGTGAQPCDDFCFSIAVKRNGWKLAYDPAALVHHFASKRQEDRQYVGVQRLKDSGAFRDYAYNQVYSIWNALSPARRLGLFLWSLLIGTGTFPGIVQAVRFTPRLGLNSWKRFFVAQVGRTEAFRDLMLGRVR